MQTVDIQVAIVEDDTEIRQTLALIIDGTPGFNCKLTYANGFDAFEALQKHYVEVVLMDIEMPKMNGIDCIRKLKPLKPTIDFLMLTIKQDDESIFDSIYAGASGYLLKDTPPVRLLEAIREIKNGGAPMSTSIARKVIQSFHQVKASPLSDRETEILRYLAGGENYKSIANQLFISPHTVKTHIKNIYDKLHVHSRAEAVRKAIEDRLI